MLGPIVITEEAVGRYPMNITNVTTPPMAVPDFSTLLYSKHWSLKEAEDSKMPVQVIAGSNGMFERRSNGIGSFVAKTKCTAGLQYIREGLHLSLPKIPYAIYQQTVSFFKGVMKRLNNSEAIVHIYWNSVGKEYVVIAPPQEVGPGTCRYKADYPVPDGYVFVADLHSHNTMGAGFSGIDDKDDKELRIFGVVGKLDNDTPEYKFRACVGGTHIDIKFLEVFEAPVKDVAVPEEWFGQVKKYEVPTQTHLPYSRAPHLYGAGVVSGDEVGYNINTHRGWANLSSPSSVVADAQAKSTSQSVIGKDIDKSLDDDECISILCMAENIDKKWQDDEKELLFAILARMGYASEMVAAVRQMRKEDEECVGGLSESRATTEA